MCTHTCVSVCKCAWIVYFDHLNRQWFLALSLCFRQFHSHSLALSPCLIALHLLELCSYSSSSPITALSTHRSLFLWEVWSVLRYIMKRLNRFSIYQYTPLVYSSVFGSHSGRLCIGSVAFVPFGNWLGSFSLIVCVPRSFSVSFLSFFSFLLLSMATHLTGRARVCDTCKWAKHQAI